MKVISKLTAVLLLVVSLWACDDPMFDDIKIDPLSLDVDVVSVDEVMAKVEYDDEDIVYPYVLGVIEKSQYEGLLLGDDDDEEDDQKVADYMLSELNDLGVDAVTVDNKYVFSGDVSVNLADTWAFEQAKEYYVVAFAVNAAGELITELEEEDTDEIPGPQDQRPDAPEVEVETTTYSSIIIDVDVKDYEGNYFVGLVFEDDMEENYDDDENLVAQELIKKYIESGASLTKPDELFLFNGSQKIDLGKSYFCQGDTEFSLIMFGVNESGEIVTKVHVEDVSTEDFPTEEVDIDIENITPSNIIYSAKADSSDDIFLVFLVEKSIYENQMDSNDKYFAELVVNTFVSQGIDPRVPDYTYVFEGEAKSAHLNLGFKVEAKTEYVFAAFVIDENNKMKSDINTEDVTTPDFETDGNLESIEISEITYVDAKVEVDAGDYKGNYYVAPFLKDELDEDYGGDIDKMLKFMIEYELEYGTDFGVADGTWVFNGDASFDLSDGGWNIRPNEKYYVFAFGVLPDGTIVTNVLQSELFSTLSTEGTTIDIKIKGVNDDKIEAEFTPSKDDVSYFSGIILKSLTEGKTDEQIMTLVKEKYGILEMLDELETGDQSKSFDGLNAGTEYLIVSCVYYPATSMIGELFKVEVKTTGEALEDLEVPQEIIIPDVDFGEFTLDEITTSSIKVDLDPEDDDVKYLVNFFSQGYYDKFKSDEELIKSELEFFQSQAGNSFREYLDSKTHQGDKSVEFKVLPEVDYVLYVFAIDLKTGQPLSKVKILTCSNKGLK